MTNTAIFSNGHKVTRNGKIKYAFAWLVDLKNANGHRVIQSGMTHNKASAEKNMNRELKACTKFGYTAEQFSEVIEL